MVLSNVFPNLTMEEELANSITHAMGAGFAITVLGLSIKEGILTKYYRKMIGNIIFSIGLLILFLNSSIYHGLPKGELKITWRYLDHVSIFLLIAASYTPLCLTNLYNLGGIKFLTFVWSIAILGITLKLLFYDGYLFLFLGLYLAMGWCFLIVAKNVLKSSKKEFLIWLLIGGILYSVGVYFYANDHKHKFFHFIWHFVILIAAGCHSIAMLYYL